MNASNMKKASETDWARIDAMTDEMIDTSDIPPLSEEFFARATWRMPKPSVSVNVRVETEVLDWFKAQGDDYTLLMSAALRIYAEAHKNPHTLTSPEQIFAVALFHPIQAGKSKLHSLLLPRYHSCHPTPLDAHRCSVTHSLWNGRAGH